ncbi:MAG: sugar ABC transporter permease [Chloroflexi bacterium]|nr:sugar ABC transporter permease [Chloroflexota bacterium]
MSISSERQEPGIAAPVERRARRRRRARDRLSFGEFLVFLAPLLIFLILLYGMLIWTFYVSVADWRGVAPNYTFAGFKWYDMMFDLARFRQDVVNNLKWLVIGVIPTVVVALFIAYIL